MMKKIAASVLALGLVFAFTACSSIETGTTLNGLKLSSNENDKPIAHVNGQIWGLYFFYVLPMFSGSSSKVGNCAVFSDTVRVENVVRMMTKKAKQDMNASKLLDLQSERSNFYFLFPLFSIKTVDASANAVE